MCACLDTGVVALLQQINARQQLNKLNQKAKMLAEHNTFSLFAVLYIMANLFHGVLDKSL